MAPPQAAKNTDERVPAQVGEQGNRDGVAGNVCGVGRGNGADTRFASAKRELRSVAAGLRASVTCCALAPGRGVAGESALWHGANPITRTVTFREGSVVTQTPHFARMATAYRAARPPEATAQSPRKGRSDAQHW
jgi:hypothetical protein